MTRAESRLIVCGPHMGRANAKLKPGCWYDWVKRGMEALNAQPFDAPAQREGQENSEQGLIYGSEPEPCAGAEAEADTETSDMPPWVTTNAAPEGRSQRVTPSHLLSDPPAEMAVRSPAHSSDPNVFRRGNLIHKLLEVLPEIPAERRRDTAEKMLSGYADLSPGLSAQITEEVFTVLEHPDFAYIFAPGSRAEVSLAGSAKGLPEGLYLNAQIDRLCVTPEAVTIVDYKSNRPPPTDPADVAELYLGQMAAYRELAREIYPRPGCDLRFIVDGWPAFDAPAGWVTGCRLAESRRASYFVSHAMIPSQERPMATTAVTDATFSDDVLNSDTPVLLDFWAEWCGPCKKMGPALEEVSEAFEGRVKIAKMDIQDNPDTPGKFHVRGIPTLMIFKDGQVVATKVGEMNKAKLSEWLSEHA